MKLLSLIIIIFATSTTSFAATSTGTVTVTCSAGTGGSCQSPAIITGTSAILTATVTGVSGIGQVAFYNGVNYIGASNIPTTPGGNTYTFTWTNPVTSALITAKVFGTTGAFSPVGVNTGVVIDMVGSSSVLTPPAPSPVHNPSFGEQSMVGNGQNTWVEGDNQFCSTNGAPYNGANTAYPDGSCEWMNQANINGVTNSGNPTLSSGVETTDALDETMHTLSDFTNFSRSLLNLGQGSLISTFSNWYPQAKTWIAPACPPTLCSIRKFEAQQCTNDANCNEGGLNGRLLNLYNPNVSPPTDIFNNWNANVITPWLNNTYVSPQAWCVPPSASFVSNNPEFMYINDPNNSGPGAWGDMPHVISCLNYNAALPSAGYGPAYNYQQCLNALTNEASTCATFPPSCAPQLLGRTMDVKDLVSNAPPAFNAGNVKSCDQTQPGSFAQYVSNSAILATDEAPKFALRSSFLSDIYNRAKTMQSIFSSGHSALANFFKTCAGCGDGSSCPVGGGTCKDGSECGVNATTTCQDGGPVAQLQFAANQASPVVNLPNAVIYGWFDNRYPDGHPGYGHIVKATVYSPGRQGVGFAQAQFVNGILPWIKTWETFFLRIYELSDRDGYVYVSVKRWDQDHSGTIRFPNHRKLWKFLFSVNNNGVNFQATNGIPNVCLDKAPGYSVTVPGAVTQNYGFGLLPETVAGLNTAMLPKTGAGAGGGEGAVMDDQRTLASAFMLNDKGYGTLEGQIDPAAKADQSDYRNCLIWANQALENGVESHACARYIASRSPNRVQSLSSGNNDGDYSVVFVDCAPLFNSINYAPDDLLPQQGANT